MQTLLLEHWRVLLREVVQSSFLGKLGDQQSQSFCSHSTEGMGPLSGTLDVSWLILLLRERGTQDSERMETAGVQGKTTLILLFPPLHL